MKKLSLILGSLLIAATASAKEVVAAPVVVEEVVVEEPVVVAAPEWRATADIEFENEYQGEGEHGRNGDNGKVYQELNANFNITETDTIRLRVRNREAISSGDDAASESHDLRWRWDHKFGYIGDTKIKQTTRFEWRDHEDFDMFQISDRFNFVEYMPKFENFHITDSTLAPKVRYNDYNDNDDDQSTGIGMDYYFYADSDFGKFGTLEYELSVYYVYSDNGAFSEEERAIGGGTPKYLGDYFDGGDYTSNGHNTSIEAYLYHTLPLWDSESGKYRVQFFQEGGLDPVVFSSGSHNGDQTLYYEPKMQLVHKLNGSTEFIYSAGGYYCNNETNDSMHQGNYEWEPRVGLMIKSTF